MTKKEYMKPTMDVVEIKGCTLLAGSPTLPVGDDDTTITSGETLAPPMSAPSVEDILNPFPSLPSFPF